MKKTPIFYFLLSLCVGLFFILVFGAYMLSFSYISREANRSEIFLKQINASFNAEYRRINEEFYVNSYEAISMRIASLAHDLGDADYDLFLLNKAGDCVYAVGKNGVLPCAESKVFESYVKSYLNVLVVNPTTTYDSRGQRYEYFVSLVIGLEHQGYLYVRISDPYGFYRGTELDFLADTFLAPIIFSLMIFSLFVFYYWRFKISPYLIKTMAIEKNEALSRLAARLAHDIQAPLEVLKGLVANTREHLPEDDRRLLQNVISRIKNMSSDLIANNTGVTRNNADFSFAVDCIDTIISEKQVLLEKTNVQIEWEVPADLLSLGVRISSFELSRVLSNIINNAIDAFQSTKKNPKIKVTFSRDSLSSNVACVVIQDNGSGMSPEILKKVSTIGGTYGKPMGAGIGLSHARECLYAVGGSLKISSALGVGTEVVLKIPVAEKPLWLKTEISIPSDETIVIVEDDVGFGELLKNKLGAFNCVLLSDPSEFHPELYPVKTCTYFIDFEYRGTRVNGLDLIKSYNLGAKAILTTSYFNEALYQEEIVACGSGILPKFLANNLKVETLASSSRPTEVCLIDDDELVRMSWSIQAKRKKITLKSYDSIESFKGDLPSFGAYVFFDNNFSSSEKGAEIADLLYEKGYRNLFMVTGDCERLKQQFLPKVKDVLNKEFPSHLF